MKNYIWGLLFFILLIVEIVLFCILQNNLILIPTIFTVFVIVFHIWKIIIYNKKKIKESQRNE